MRGLFVNGREVRRTRREHGLTQEALATAAGCDVRTIRTAEKRGRLDAATVKRIAAALGASLAAIVLNSGDLAAGACADLFHRWQAAFNECDVDALLRLYHDGAALIVPAADDLPGSGEFYGPDAIRQLFVRTFRAFDVEKLTPLDYKVDVACNFVFARGTPSATVKATGKRFTMPALSELEVRDGKIYRHTIFADTAPMRRCLAGGPTGASA